MGALLAAPPSIGCCAGTHQCDRHHNVLTTGIGRDGRLGRAGGFPFRAQQMHEVDIVLERDDGMIVGIEVEAAATVKSSDFAGLRTLAEACRERFAYGVVLYDNTDLVPFGDRLAAARG